MAGPIPASKAPVSINMALAGEPGSGKSIMAASSASQGGKVCILDADFGTESAVIHKMDFDVWPEKMTGFQQLWEAFTWFNNEKHDYDWVWLDSGSLFQEKALHDELMSNVVISKPHRNEYVPDVQEYLIVQNQFAKAVRAFCALPVNFGITAYPEDFDLGEPQTVIMPMFAGSKGKYAQKICGYLNFVGFLGVDSKSEDFSNRLITRRTGRYYAKNRFGLPDVIESPDMGLITKMIQNAQEA